MTWVCNSGPGEVWKPIPGYEGFYEASNLGRIRSLDRVIIRKNGQRQTCAGRILSPCIVSGYPFVQLHGEDRRKGMHVHKLIALAFHGSPEDTSYEVNHKDLNHRNNTPGNLEWVSREDNLRHAHENGAADFRKAMYSNNTTGVKGVSVYRGGLYEVRFNRKYLGRYPTLEEATKRRKEAEIAYAEEHGISWNPDS